MNTIKTVVLLALMTALFGSIGFFLGGQQGMLIALIFAAFMNIGSWWFSDTMVLKLYGAKEVKSGKLHSMTESLAKKANMPVPRVYLMQNRQPNAFAPAAARKGAQWR